LAHQYLLQLGWLLDELEPPSFPNLQEQLELVTKKKDDLRNQMASWRDVVAHGKNISDTLICTKFRNNIDICLQYIQKTPQRDHEDVIFQDTLQLVSELRQPTYIRCSKLLAKIQEVKRQMLLIESTVGTVHFELKECTAVLGESSASEADAELVALK